MTGIKGKKENNSLEAVAMGQFLLTFEMIGLAYVVKGILNFQLGLRQMQICNIPRYLEEYKKACTLLFKKFSQFKKKKQYWINKK